MPRGIRITLRPLPLAVAAALAVLIGAGALAVAKPAKPRIATKVVSVRSDGKEVNADNDFPAISGNGRYVSFESVGRFTKGDAVASEDVFVHDRLTGKTRRASLRSNGKQLAGSASADSSISSDGRFVAFLSDGAFVPADKNGTIDAYVKDMKSDEIRRASVLSNGNELVYDAENPVISGNGRYVAFDSEGPFVAADTNGLADVFRHDMKTGKTIRVSLRSDGSQVVPDLYGNGNSTDPSISADGNLVAFESTDDAMTPEPDYDFTLDGDVFARNVSGGTTVRVSIKPGGTEAATSQNQGNKFPAVSGNGRFVAFTADGFGAFVPGDTNNGYDVYVRDLKTGSLSRVSLQTDGSESPASSGGDAPAAISFDGSRIAFESFGKLVPGDTNLLRDVYVRDRKAKRTLRISVTNKGKSVNGYPHQLPGISADGHWVAFSSQGRFTAGDSGVDFDSFERGPLR